MPTDVLRSGGSGWLSTQSLGSSPLGSLRISSSCSLGAPNRHHRKPVTPERLKRAYGGPAGVLVVVGHAGACQTGDDSMPFWPWP